MGTKTGGDRNVRLRRFVRGLVTILGPALVCFAIWRGVFWMDVSRERAALHKAGLPLELSRLDEWCGGDETARANAADMLSGLNSLKTPVNAWTNLPFVNRDSNSKTGKPLDPAALAAARDYLQTNQAALAKARAALGRGHYRFLVDFTEGYLMLLPHLPKVRLAASLCALEASCMAGERDFSGAARAIQDIGGFSRCLADEPLGISYLIRIRLKTMQLEAVERLISTESVGAACLAALQACVEPEEDFIPQYRRLLGAEVACGVSLLESPPGGFSEEIDRLAGKADIPVSAVKAWLDGWFFELSGFRDRDEWCFLKSFHVLWKASALPALERVHAGLAVREHLEANAKEDKLAVSAMMLPGVVQFASRELAVLARSPLTRVAVAVERYRARHDGKLPAGLDDLVADGLPVVPLNPVTGEKISFRPLPTGYRLETQNVPGRLAFDKPGQFRAPTLRFEARH